MPIFSDAWRAFLRNWNWVGAYVGGTACFSAGMSAFNHWARAETGEGPVPPAVAGLGLAVDLAYSAAFAALLAIVFAGMGKEMDRPMWKCAGPGEALRRYFTPWFLLILLSMAVVRVQLQAAAADNGSLVLLLEFLRLCLVMLVLPVGACIMYHRGLVWRDFSAAVGPLLRLPGATIGILLLGMVQWSGTYILVGAIPKDMRDFWWITIPIDIPIALLDCYIFCAVWHICMLDRDIQSEDAGGGMDF